MEIATDSKARQTKYATAVSDILRDLKHATNHELLVRAQLLYPEVSATTIHRVTSRLKARGVIGCAPKHNNGSERYDANPMPHHHFTCVTCWRVCDFPDTAEANAVLKQLKKLSSDCAIAGTLTMQGVCRRCFNKGNKEV